MQIKGVRYLEQKSKEKDPLVEVVVRAMVPKPQADFLKAFLRFVKVSEREFWEEEIRKTVDCLAHDLGAGLGWTSGELISEAYRLKEDC